MTNTYIVGSWIDDFSKSDEKDARVNAMSNLVEIAKELGPEKTRDDLFIFLRHFLDDDDDVALVMAEQLGNMLPYIGGAEHVDTIIPLLEGLANTEEANIRDEAIHSLLNVMEQSCPGEIQEFIDLTFRLARADWFTSRSSSLGLFSSVYELAPEKVQAELNELFVQLGRDSMPLVRRAVSSKLGEWKTVKGKVVKGFCQVVSQNVVQEKMVPLFIALAQDDQDSVKFLAVESCASLSARLSSEQNNEMVVPVLNKLFVDPSWRVRYMVAENLPQLQKSLGGAYSEKRLLEVFISMLRDNEPEVRTVACGSVSEFCKNLPESSRLSMTCESIFPICTELVVDTSQQVRASLASKLLHLSVVLGKEKTIDLLLPQMLKLLKDESPEVRLVIISNLQYVNEVIGVYPLASSLIPAISELAEDRQWRVRLAVIKYIPMLAKLLGEEVRDQFSNFCVTWLVDCVYSIRDAATQCVKDLTEIFGLEWASQSIFVKILKLKDHPNYLYRMTSLFCINALLPILTKEMIEKDIIPVVAGLYKDSVANVRFNVAKTMGHIIEISSDKKDCVKLFVPLLEEMKSDKDRDVKYYALSSLEISASA